jgi:cell wall-associated NlpC family hydrolase
LIAVVWLSPFFQRIITSFLAVQKTKPKKEKIEIQEVKPGDLLFFATSGAAKVNHVGIVNGISSGGEVTFIHASTSKGVIISSLNDAYWNKAFLFARRVL